MSPLDRTKINSSDSLKIWLICALKIGTQSTYDRSGKEKHMFRFGLTIVTILSWNDISGSSKSAKSDFGLIGRSMSILFVGRVSLLNLNLISFIGSDERRFRDGLRICNETTGVRMFAVRDWATKSAVNSSYSSSRALSLLTSVRCAKIEL